MANVENTAVCKEMLKRVSLKKVKTGVGHDLAGWYCDFYLDGKKMGYLNDDGYGGEVDVRYESKDAQTKFESFLTSNNFAQLMFDNGWNFMESVDKLDLHTQTVCLLESAVNLLEAEKVQKKIQKVCESGIVWGTVNYYNARTYKVPMAELVSKHGATATASIQKMYNEVKAKLKPGETIFNRNLEQLGITL